MSAALNNSGPTATLSITNYLGFDKGDFLQIDMRLLELSQDQTQIVQTLLLLEVFWEQDQ